MKGGKRRSKRAALENVNQRVWNFFIRKKGKDVFVWLNVARLDVTMNTML